LRALLLFLGMLNVERTLLKLWLFLDSIGFLELF
jgi:hypothetical protein